MTAKRQRLTPDESRARAIEAARFLLLEGGPNAVTLKAVAARIGQTHANLLHHFGTASSLQAAVMEDMARHLVKKVSDSVYQRRQGNISIADMIDTVFDTYDKDGAGRLASWMILTGEHQALDPVVRIMHDFTNQIASDSPANKPREITLLLTLLALGDSLLGAPFAEAMGLERSAVRVMAQQLFCQIGFSEPVNT